MTAGTPAPPPSPPPPPGPPPAAATVPVKPDSQGRRVAIGLIVLLAVVTVYVLSLFVVHLLAKSGPKLPAVDLTQYQKEDSIVQLRLDKLETVANRLTVNVLVYPQDSLIDQNAGVLTSDAVVRLY